MGAHVMESKNKHEKKNKEKQQDEKKKIGDKTSFCIRYTQVKYTEGTSVDPNLIWNLLEILVVLRKWDDVDLTSVATAAFSFAVAMVFIQTTQTLCIITIECKRDLSVPCTLIRRPSCGQARNRQIVYMERATKLLYT